MFSFHPIDYLRNGTIFGGRSRYRILSECGDYLGLPPIDVYRIGRNFFDNCHKNSLYNNQYIICRYAFISITPMKTFEPLFEYVRKGKVLDFGSGIGICFDAIRNNLHYEKYFLDIPGPAFDFVKYKYSDSHFIHAPCSKFGEEYDLIVLTDVLEHLDSEGLVLAEAYRVLDDEGVMFCTTPNEQGVIGKFSQKFFPDDPTHINKKNPQEWKAAISKAGFKQIEIEGVIFHGFPPIPKLRNKFKNLGFPVWVRPFFFPFTLLCGTLYITAMKNS